MKKNFTLFLFLMMGAFISNAQTNCDPVTITNVEHEGAGNRITWTPPTGIDEKTISQGGNYSNCMYIGEESGGVYHRFTPDQLFTINGGALTQVVFAPTHLLGRIPGHTYTLKVYKGGVWGAAGSRDPGTPVVSQELNNDDLRFNEENTITLETPVTIDASQELWIGYYCTNIDSITIPKEPAGIDAGPAKDGFGNIFFHQNEWKTILEVSSTANFNFCIKGKVQTIDGATVNLFFNGEKIEEKIPGTTYLHAQPTGAEHCYKVQVNCAEGGNSPFSEEVCIPGTGIREHAANFSIYPNPVKNLLTITRTAAANAQVEIYNVLGVRVKYLEINDMETNINVSSLTSGIYLMRLMDEQGVSVQRFVKEKQKSYFLILNRKGRKDLIVND
jgi:hypothetical protein